MVNKAVLRQLLAVIAGSVSVMNAGVMLGWTSPIMQELLGPDSPIPMTVSQSSWFVSASNWAVLLGSVPSGVIADRWGRAATLRAVGPASVATWAAVPFARTVGALAAVRFAQGLLAAAAYAVAPVYAAEVAGPEVRGALGAVFQAMLHLGIVFAYAAGAWLDFRRLPYAVLAFQAAAAGASLAWLPETPHFYAMAGRPADAARTVGWLRGRDGDGGELDAMLAECGATAAAAAGRGDRASLAELFADAANLRPLSAVLALSVFRVAAGPLVVTSYASVTFAEMRVDAAAAGPNALSLGFGVLMLAATVAGATFADRAGRRPLMVASSALCAAFDAAIAAYMYLDRRTAWDVSGHGWLCAAAAAGLAAAYCAGLGTLCGTVGCELFPGRTRAAASAVGAVTTTAAALVAVKLYPVVADGGARMYRNFVAFAAFSLASAAFCWLWLPETKGDALAAPPAPRRPRSGRP